MSDGLALLLAFVLLAITLAAAVGRRPWMSEAAAAAVGATLLIAVGAISPPAAGRTLTELAPTVGFLAALLLIAEGCRRERFFEVLGAVMARGSRGRPRRLLALVFGIAAGVTAVLSLDATVVLLTPVVFATAARIRTSPKPHVYACSHLANSASLLLPVSNLTNLLAFHASGLSFAGFGALMLLPTVAVVAVEWVVLKRFFAVDLGRPRTSAPSPAREPLPRFALAVLILTLAGFALSSVVGLEPVWIAAAGAAAVTAPSLAGGAATLSGLARAVEPGLLLFVLGLGVIVQVASDNGLASAVGAVMPDGGSLPDLLLVALLSALLANLVNNLPATLLLVPILAAGGHGQLLAGLIGLNVGPNLTYAGSLATLLWRRVLHAEDADAELGEFLRLGMLTVPGALVAATVLLWFGLQV